MASIDSLYLMLDVAQSPAGEDDAAAGITEKAVQDRTGLRKKTL